MRIQRLKYIEFAVAAQGYTAFPDLQELRGKYIHGITYMPFRNPNNMPYYSYSGYTPEPKFSAIMETPFLLSLREVGKADYFMQNVNVTLFRHQFNLVEAVHINKVLDFPNCTVFNPLGSRVVIAFVVAYGDATVDSTDSNDYIPVCGFSREIEFTGAYRAPQYIGSSSRFVGKKIKGLFCNHTTSIGIYGKTFANLNTNNYFLTLGKGSDKIFDKVPLPVFAVAGGYGYVRTGTYALDDIEIDGENSYIEVLPMANGAHPYPMNEIIQLNFLY